MNKYTELKNKIEELRREQIFKQFSGQQLLNKLQEDRQNGLVIGDDYLDEIREEYFNSDFDSTNEEIENLSYEELAKMIQAQGAVFNSYAEGAFDEFMKNGNPELITKEQYYLFFTILICSFALMFWLCNFTIMKETFQIIMMSALSIALAEYFTRRYFKL